MVSVMVRRSLMESTTVDGAGRRMAKPRPVSLEDGTVETELLGQSLDLFVRGRHPELIPGNVPGSECQ